MKKRTVFLASSIGERIHFFMCEHADTAIALHGKQNEYDDYIKKPWDLFINLYYTKAGEYTVEEFFEYAVRDFCGQYIAETVPKTADDREFQELQQKKTRRIGF